MAEQNMYASKGIELLRELKRTELLPKYNVGYQGSLFPSTHLSLIPCALLA